MLPARIGSPCLAWWAGKAELPFNKSGNWLGCGPMWSTVKIAAGIVEGKGAKSFCIASTPP
jgi:hypothetical protein